MPRSLERECVVLALAAVVVPTTLFAVVDGSILATVATSLLSIVYLLIADPCPQFRLIGPELFAAKLYPYFFAANLTSAIVAGCSLETGVSTAMLQLLLLAMVGRAHLFRQKRRGTTGSKRIKEARHTK